MLRTNACLLAALTLSAGCAAEPASPLDNIDLSDGKADANGWDVLDIELGETVTGLSIEPLQGSAGSATNAQLQRSIVLVRVRLAAGQSASITMRAESAELDPYLLVRTRSGGGNITDCDNQAWLATASETDAAVSLTAVEDEEYLVFATGGSSMTTGGTFSVDAVAIENPHVDLAVSSPAQRAITAELRRHEEQLARFIALGAARETDDGFTERVIEGLGNIELRERAALFRAVEATNVNRELLYDAMIERSGDAQATRATIGVALAPVHRATRDLEQFR